MTRTEANKAAHAIAARRWGKADAHTELCAQFRVSSLKLVSDVDLAAWVKANHIPMQSPPPRPRGPRLCNTVMGDATDDQRQAIEQWFVVLKWPESKRRNWLKRRFGIEDHLRDELYDGDASKIISCLANAAKKGPGGRVSKSTTPSLGLSVSSSLLTSTEAACST